jgi:hypothetical protein
VRERVTEDPSSGNEDGAPSDSLCSGEISKGVPPVRAHQESGQKRYLGHLPHPPLLLCFFQSLQRYPHFASQTLPELFPVAALAF